MGWYSSRGGLSRDVPVKKIKKVGKLAKQACKATTPNSESKEPFTDLRTPAKK